MLNFDSDSMEAHYLAFHIQSLADRFRPTMQYGLLLSWGSVILFISIIYLKAHELTWGERIISGIRVIFTFILTAVHCVEWNAGVKGMAGYIYLWTHRTAAFMAILQQGGVHQHDSNLMILVLWMLFFCGPLFPTFYEQLFYTLMIASTRPFCSLLSTVSCRMQKEHSCSDSQLFSEIAVYSLLMSVSIVVNYRIHATLRRTWFLSQAICPNDQTGPSISPLQTSRNPICAAEAHWKGSKVPFHSNVAESPNTVIDEEVGAQDPATEWRPQDLERTRVIGAGAYGMVYEARDRATGRLLAVKEVQLPHQSAQAGLNAELRLLPALRHPSLARYLSVSCDGGTLRLVMELVGGGSLASLLARRGPLAEPAARAFARQVVAGVAFLHSRDVVCRDLKCENCLLTPSGRVRLVDFGPVHRAKLLLRMATESSNVHLAPEVLRRERGAAGQPAADVWSTGCCALRMLTLRTPLGTEAARRHDYAELLRIATVSSPHPHTPAHLPPRPTLLSAFSLSPHATPHLY